MGQPKGLLTLKGQPILDYLLDALAWPGPTLLVTAPGREHPPGWERFDNEAADPESGGGPLRGVLTALESMRHSLAGRADRRYAGDSLDALRGSAGSTTPDA